MYNGHFKLFENCIPVKGAVRSVICDLQRFNISFIPNDLFEILETYRNESIAKIKESFGAQEEKTIEEYFKFLFEEEYIFCCEKEELNLFPKLDLTWDAPAMITNSIIDIGTNSRFDFETIFAQLEALGCGDIQLRYFCQTELDTLDAILFLLVESRIKSVELIISYNSQISEHDFIDLARKHLRLCNIIVHSAPYEKTVMASKDVFCDIHFFQEVINDSTHCGYISPRSFTVNVDTFTESQKNNTCLNRKISIDENGEIKNCPALKQSYGNIHDVKLIDVLTSNDDFRTLWSINKAQIEVCRDCEFRYVCSDCRAFITDDKNIYSKPLKCNYDPYTATWKSENENN